jgi:seryl-tRNA synthetase
MKVTGSPRDYTIRRNLRRLERCSARIRRLEKELSCLRGEKKRLGHEISAILKKQETKKTMSDYMELTKKLLDQEPPLVTMGNKFEYTGPELKWRDPDEGKP